MLPLLRGASLIAFSSFPVSSKVVMNLSSQAAVMNFLNEVADEFPSAISLAAGRPTDQFFKRLEPGALIDAFVRYEKYASRGNDPIVTRARLLQYGRTSGIIADLIAQQLSIDEQVNTSAEQIIVTSGCQEALALCFSALCPDPADVVLFCNPTYIGAVGAALATGVAVFPIPNTLPDIVKGIERAVFQLGQNNRRARALYLIPTFDNPTGRVFGDDQRKAILSLCAELRIVIVEDNPYGMFRYEGQAIRPIAASDKVGSVIYLSTFSKTITPALRVGAVALPETLFGDKRAGMALLRNVIQRKSVLTLNTSQITQSIVGGLLLEQNGSLEQWVKPALAWYKNNRDAMLIHLQSAFAHVHDSIRWNHPPGGFFLSVDLPFQFGADDVVSCASDYGVIVMPMSFFSMDNSQDNRVRLSFSAADTEQIYYGVTSLSRYVSHRRVHNSSIR
jgi:(S)-3,5-dihydroxyphenylglycine transaminase